MLSASIDPAWRSRAAESVCDADCQEGRGNRPNSDIEAGGPIAGRVLACIRVLSEEHCCFRAQVAPPRGGHMISESNEYVREGELVRVDIEGHSYYAQNVGTTMLEYTARMDLQVEMGPFARRP